MDNQLEELYKRFREELSNNDISLYYDEGEIADIFDYAGDMRDDYVRLEALMAGNRLFPDSELLLERRAIWLANMGNNALKQFLADHPRINPSVIWTILEARANAPMSPEQSENTLNSIIEHYRLRDDETIIQFVALVRHLQQEEWLIKNLDRVRDICDFSPTLLYEIARMADNRAQIDLSIHMLEELTELDAFNTDYWALLAELQCNSGHHEESLSSLEYAKALSPEDVELLTIEGFNQLRLNRIDEAINTFEHALTIDPGFFPAKRNLFEAYRSKNNNGTPHKLLRELYEEDSTDPQLFIEMLQAFPGEISRIATRYHSGIEPDENDAIQRVSIMCQNGHERQALTYIKWYADNYGLSQGAQMVYIELLYHNEMLHEAYDYMAANIKAPVLSPNELPIIAVIASLLLKLQLFDDARAFCRSWIEKLNKAVDAHNSTYLISRGIRDILLDISKLLDANPTPTEEQIAKVTV